MDEAEYGELFRHLRTAVRERRQDIDAALMDSSRIDGLDARGQVLAYLEGLRDQMYNESEQAARQVQQKFSQFESDDGRQVGGIEVEVSPNDREAYGIASFELTGTPGHDRFVGEIDELIAQISEDLQQ
jgi:hypothetical protein